MFDLVRLNVGVTTGIRGKQRTEVLRLHRLFEFERVDLYLKGEASSALLTARAHKMLECGLPRIQ